MSESTKHPTFREISSEAAENIDIVGEAIEGAVSAAAKTIGAVTEGSHVAVDAARDGIADGLQQATEVSRELANGIKAHPVVAVMAVGLLAAVVGFILTAVRDR